MAGSAWTNQVQNQVIIAGSQGQLLVYNGTPGANNLIYSITSRQFTDPYGNLVLAGSTAYKFSNVNGNFYLATNMNGTVTSGNVIEFYYASSEAGPWTRDAVIGNGPLTAGANPTLAVTADTWHNMTLLNGWANQAGWTPARYQLLGSPPNSVRVQGVINASAATTFVFFTLPAGYVPSGNGGYAAGANAGVPANQSPQVRWDSSGNLSVNSVGLGAANAVWISGIVNLD
jgi:hypothetical protein